MRLNRPRDWFALALLVIVVAALWSGGSAHGKAEGKVVAERALSRMEREKDRAAIAEDALAAEEKAHKETSETAKAYQERAAEASDTILDLMLKLERTKDELERARQKAAAAERSSAAPASGSGWRSARVSWYGPGFYGNTMAGGGVLTRSSMVVAHRSMRFGTKIQIRYRGKTVTAEVRDRGPYIAGRTFDLGPGVARALDFSGVGTISWRVVG